MYIHTHISFVYHRFQLFNLSRDKLIYWTATEVSSFFKYNKSCLAVHAWRQPATCTRSSSRRRGNVFFHSVSRLKRVARKASACCSTDSRTMRQNRSDTAMLRFCVVIWLGFSTPSLATTTQVTAPSQHHTRQWDVSVKTNTIRPADSFVKNVLTKPGW